MSITALLVSAAVVWAVTGVALFSLGEWPATLLWKFPETSRWKRRLAEFALGPLVWILLLMGMLAELIVLLVGLVAVQIGAYTFEWREAVKRGRKRGTPHCCLLTTKAAARPALKAKG